MVVVFIALKPSYESGEELERELLDHVRETYGP